MSAAHRVAAIAVAVLVVVGLGIVALTLADAPVAADPSPSAAASATPDAPGTSADASAAASATPDPDQSDILAAVTEIEEQVIAIRGLPAADIGPPDIITRDELRDEIAALLDAEYPPEERERDNRTLRALGLLEPDEDVAELQLQLLGDQVLGFYDPEERRMVVVTDAGFDAAAKLTYAHEYTHALQDAAFGLEDPDVEELDEDDRALARTTLIEGDATVTMLAWAFEHLTQEELLEIGTGTELPDTSGIPSWVVNQLQFPYTVGQVWAGTLTGNPLSPDFAAVDAAFEDPPVSTEQVIHLDAWQSREPPVEVETVDLVATLGDGWELVDETVMGEAIISIVLQHFGASVDAADVAAAGWGGDRMEVAYLGEEFAVAWRLSWDAPEDAAEFSAAYGEIVPTLPFPAEITELPGGDVLVVHGSNDEVVKQVVDAAR
jgi:hypothetical protein